MTSALVDDRLARAAIAGGAIAVLEKDVLFRALPALVGSRLRGGCLNRLPAHRLVPEPPSAPDRQRTAFLTSARILASSAAVSSFSA